MCYVSTYRAPQSAVKLLDDLGEDNIMLGSDFRTPNGTAGLAGLIQRELGPSAVEDPPQDRRDNAAKL